LDGNLKWKDFEDLFNIIISIGKLETSILTIRVPKGQSNEKRLQMTILEFYYTYYFMIIVDLSTTITRMMSC